MNHSKKYNLKTEAAVMTENDLRIIPDDTSDAKLAYESALDILADIVLAYLASEKAKDAYPGRTGGIGSTIPHPFAPVAA